MQSILLSICPSCVIIENPMHKLHPIWNHLKASKIIKKDLRVTILLDIYLKSPKENFNSMFHIKN